MLAGSIFSIRAPSGLPWSFRAIGFTCVAVVVAVVPVLVEVPVVVAVVPVLVGVPVVADVVVVGVVVPPVGVPDAVTVVCGLPCVLVAVVDLGPPCDVGPCVVVFGP